MARKGMDMGVLARHLRGLLCGSTGAVASLILLAASLVSCGANKASTSWNDYASEQFFGASRVSPNADGTWTIWWQPPKITEGVTFDIFSKGPGAQWDFKGKPAGATAGSNWNSPDLRLQGNTCFIVRAKQGGESVDTNTHEVCTQHEPYSFQGIDDLVSLKDGSYLLKWIYPDFQGARFQVFSRSGERGELVPLGISEQGSYKTKPIPLSDKVCFVVRHRIDGFPEDTNAKELCTYKAAETTFHGLDSITSGGPSEITAWWKPFENETVAGYVVYMGQDFKREVGRVTASEGCRPQVREGTEAAWCSFSLNDLRHGVVYSLGVRAFDVYGREDANLEIKSFDLSNHPPVVSRVEVVPNVASGRPASLECRATYSDVDTWQALKPTFVFKNRKREQVGDVELIRIGGTVGQTKATYTLAESDRRGDVVICETTVDDGFGGKHTLMSAPADAANGTGTSVVVPGRAVVATGIADVLAIRNQVMEISLARGPASCAPSDTECALKGYANADSDLAMEVEVTAVQNGTVCVVTPSSPCTMAQAPTSSGQTVTGLPPFACEANGVCKFRFVPAKDHYSIPEDRDTWARVDYRVRTGNINLPDGTVVPGGTSDERSFFINVRPSPRVTGLAFRDGNQDVSYVGAVLRDYSTPLASWLGYQHTLPIVKMYTRMSTDAGSIPSERPNGEFDRSQPNTTCTQENDDAGNPKYTLCEIQCRPPTNAELTTAYSTPPSGAALTNLRSCPFAFKPNPAYYGPAVFYYSVVDVNGIASDYARAELVFQPSLRATGYALTVVQDEPMTIKMQEDPADITAARTGFSGTKDPEGNNRIAISAVEVSNSQIEYGPVLDAIPAFACAANECTLGITNRAAGGGWPGYGVARLQYRVSGFDVTLNKSVTSNWCPKKTSSDPEGCVVSLHFYPRPITTSVTLGAIEGTSTPVLVAPGDAAGATGYHHPYAGNKATSLQVTLADSKGTIAELPGGVGTVPCTSGICTLNFTPNSDPCSGAWEGCTANLSYKVTVQAPADSGLAADKRSLETLTPGTISLRLRPVPKATGLALKGLEGTPLAISVSKNTGYTYPLATDAKAVSVASITHGSLLGGGFNCTGATCSAQFIPEPGFSGMANLVYTVTVYDDVLKRDVTSAPATMAINIRPVPKATGLAGDQKIVVVENQTRDFTIRLGTPPEAFGYTHAESFPAKAVNTNGTILPNAGTTSIGSIPTRGSGRRLDCDGVGTCTGTFQPAAVSGDWLGYGDGKFNYTVSVFDAIYGGDVESNTAEAVVDVRPLPRAVGDQADPKGPPSLVVIENTARQFAIEINKGYWHPYNTRATGMIITGAAHGTAVANGCDANGKCQFTFTPEPDYSGAATVSYKVRIADPLVSYAPYSGFLESAETTTAVNVFPRPRASNLSLSAQQDKPRAITIAFDNPATPDPEGYTHSQNAKAFCIVTRNPAHGAISPFTCDAAGSCAATFTPDSGYYSDNANATDRASFDFQVVTYKDGLPADDVGLCPGKPVGLPLVGSADAKVTINVRPVPIATGLTIVDIQGKTITVALREGATTGYRDPVSPARPPVDARRISSISADNGTLSPFTCDATGCTATFTPKRDGVTNEDWYGDLSFTYAVSVNDAALGPIESEPGTVNLRIRPKPVGKPLSLAQKQGANLPLAFTIGGGANNTYNHPFAYKAYRVDVSETANGAVKNASDADGFSCDTATGSCTATFKPTSTPSFYWGNGAQFKYRIVVEDPILKAANAGNGDIASDLYTVAIDYRPVPEPTGLVGAYLKIPEGGSLPITLRWGLKTETNGYYHGDGSYHLPAYEIPVVPASGFLGTLPAFSCSESTGDCTTTFTPPSSGTTWGSTSFNYSVRVNDPVLGLLESYTQKTINVRIKPIPKATGRTVKGVQGVAKPLVIEIGKGWDFPATELMGLTDPGVAISTSAATNGTVSAFACDKTTGRCTGSFTPISADFYGVASFKYRVHVYDPDVNELVSTEKTYSIDFYPAPKTFALLRSNGNHIKGTEATAKTFELLPSKPENSDYVFCNVADGAKGLPKAYWHPYCEPAVEILVTPGSPTNATFGGNPPFLCNAQGGCAGQFVPNPTGGGWFGYGLASFQYRVRINPTYLADAELTPDESNALTSPPSTAEVEYYPVPKTRDTAFWAVEGFATQYSFEKCNGTPIESCSKSYVHGYDHPATQLTVSSASRLKTAGPFNCDVNGKCTGTVEPAVGYFSVGSNPADRASFSFKVRVDDGDSNTSQATFNVYPRPHAQDVAVEGVQAEDVDVVVALNAGYTHADGGQATFLEFMAPEGGTPLNSQLCPNSTTNNNCYPCAAGVCTLKFHPGTTENPFLTYWGAARVFFRVLMDGPGGMPAELKPALASEWASAAITILPKPVALPADLVLAQDSSKAFAMGVAPPAIISYSHPQNAPATAIMVQNGVVNGSKLDINSTAVVGSLLTQSFMCSAGSCSNVFTPNAGFYGSSAFDFKVKVNDHPKLISLNTASVNIDVRPLPVTSNVSTYAVEGETVAVDIGQGLGFSHPYNQGFSPPALPFPPATLTKSLETRGTLGSLTCGQSCTATFTPTAGWIPDATTNKASFRFTATVTDPKLGAMTSAGAATYEMEYRPFPRASTLALVGVEGEAKTFYSSLNSGYTHAHGLLAKAIELSALDQLSQTSATCDAPSGVCTTILQPAANFYGLGSFSYRIQVEDGVLPPAKRNLWSPLASATVDVRPKPKAPGLVFKGLEGTPQTWTMGPDVGGSPAYTIAYSHSYYATQPTVYKAQKMTIWDVSGGTVGGAGVTCSAGACTIPCNASGVCAATYTPGTVGSFTFKYSATVNDPILGATIDSLPGNGVIEVRPAPQAKNFTVYAAQIKVGENRTKTIKLGLSDLGYDDPDSPKRVITGVSVENTASLNGTLTPFACAAGVCTTSYKPTADFTGTASFTFKVKAMDIIYGAEITSFNTGVATIEVRPRPIPAPFTRYIAENLLPDWVATDAIPLDLDNAQNRGYKQANLLKAFEMAASNAVAGSLGSTTCVVATGRCTLNFTANNAFSGNASADYLVRVHDPLLDAADDILESDAGTLALRVKARPRATTLTKYLKQGETSAVSLTPGSGYTHATLQANGILIKTWDALKLSEIPVFSCNSGTCTANVSPINAGTIGNALVTYQAKVPDPDLGTDLESDTGTLNLTIRAMPRIAGGTIRNSATPEGESLVVTVARGDGYEYDDTTAWNGGIKDTVKLSIAGATKGKIGGATSATIDCADGLCQFTYTPNAGVYGMETLTYSVSVNDALLGGLQTSTNSGQFRIDIRPKPHATSFSGPMIYENITGGTAGEGRNIAAAIDTHFTYAYKADSAQFGNLRMENLSPVKGGFFNGVSVVANHTVDCDAGQTCTVKYIPNENQVDAAGFSYRISVFDKVLNQTLVSPETGVVTLDIFPAPTCSGLATQVNQYANAGLSLAKGSGWNHPRNGFSATDAYRFGVPQNGDLTSGDKHFTCVAGTCTATFAPTDPAFFSATPADDADKGIIQFRVGVTGDGALGPLYSKTSCSYKVTFYPAPVTSDKPNQPLVEGVFGTFAASPGDFYQHPWGEKADRFKVVSYRKLVAVAGAYVTKADGSALDGSNEATCDAGSGTCGIRFVADPGAKKYGYTNCDAETAAVTLRVRVGGVWSNNVSNANNAAGSSVCLNVRPQPLLTLDKTLTVREGGTIPSSAFRIKNSDGYNIFSSTFTFADCMGWRLPLLTPSAGVYTTTQGSVSIAGSGTDTSPSPAECAGTYTSTAGKYGQDTIAYTMTTDDKLLTPHIEFTLPEMGLGSYPRLLVEVRPKPRTTGKSIFLAESANGFATPQNVVISKQPWSDTSNQLGYRHPYDPGTTFNAQSIGTSNVQFGVVGSKSCVPATGVCTVEFTPDNDRTGANAAQFDYAVTVADAALQSTAYTYNASDNITSDSGTVLVSIKPRPRTTANAPVLYRPQWDTNVEVTLAKGAVQQYTHPALGATGAPIAAYANISPPAVSCSSGTCTVTVSPNPAGFVGDATFSYAVSVYDADLGISLESPLPNPQARVQFRPRPTILVAPSGILTTESTLVSIPFSNNSHYSYTALTELPPAANQIKLKAYDPVGGSFGGNLTSSIDCSASCNVQFTPDAGFVSSADGSSNHASFKYTIEVTDPALGGQVLRPLGDAFGTVNVEVRARPNTSTVPSAGTVQVYENHYKDIRIARIGSGLTYEGFSYDYANAPALRDSMVMDVGTATQGSFTGLPSTSTTCSDDSNLECIVRYNTTAGQKDAATFSYRMRVNDTRAGAWLDSLNGGGNLGWSTVNIDIYPRPVCNSPTELVTVQNTAITVPIRRGSGLGYTHDRNHNATEATAANLLHGSMSSTTVACNGAGECNFSFTPTNGYFTPQDGTDKASFDFNIKVGIEDDVTCSQVISVKPRPVAKPPVGLRVVETQRTLVTIAKNANEGDSSGYWHPYTDARGKAATLTIRSASGGTTDSPSCTNGTCQVYFTPSAGTGPASYGAGAASIVYAVTADGVESADGTVSFDVRPAPKIQNLSAGSDVNFRVVEGDTPLVLMGVGFNSYLYGAAGVTQVQPDAIEVSPVQGVTSAIPSCGLPHCTISVTPQNGYTRAVGPVQLRYRVRIQDPQTGDQIWSHLGAPATWPLIDFDVAPRPRATGLSATGGREGLPYTIAFERGANELDPKGYFHSLALNASAISVTSCENCTAQSSDCSNPGANGRCTMVLTPNPSFNDIAGEPNPPGEGSNFNHQGKAYGWAKITYAVSVNDPVKGPVGTFPGQPGTAWVYFRPIPKVNAVADITTGIEGEPYTVVIQRDAGYTYDRFDDRRPNGLALSSPTGGTTVSSLGCDGAGVCRVTFTPPTGNPTYGQFQFRYKVRVTDPDGVEVWSDDASLGLVRATFRARPRVQNLSEPQMTQGADSGKTYVIESCRPDTSIDTNYTPRFTMTPATVVDYAPTATTGYYHFEGFAPAAGEESITIENLTNATVQDKSCSAASCIVNLRHTCLNEGNPGPMDASFRFRIKDSRALDSLNTATASFTVKPRVVATGVNYGKGDGSQGISGESKSVTIETGLGKGYTHVLGRKATQVNILSIGGLSAPSAGSTINCDGAGVCAFNLTPTLADSTAWLKYRVIAEDGFQSHAQGTLYAYFFSRPTATSVSTRVAEGSANNEITIQLNGGYTHPASEKATSIQVVDTSQLHGTLSSLNFPCDAAGACRVNYTPSGGYSSTTPFNANFKYRVYMGTVNSLLDGTANIDVYPLPVARDLDLQWLQSSGDLDALPGEAFYLKFQKGDNAPNYSARAEDFADFSKSVVNVNVTGSGIFQNDFSCSAAGACWADFRPANGVISNTPSTAAVTITYKIRLTKDGQNFDSNTATARIFIQPRPVARDYTLTQFEDETFTYHFFNSDDEFATPRKINTFTYQWGPSNVVLTRTSTPDAPTTASNFSIDPAGGGTLTVESKFPPNAPLTTSFKFRATALAPFFETSSNNEGTITLNINRVLTAVDFNPPQASQFGMDSVPVNVELKRNIAWFDARHPNAGTISGAEFDSAAGGVSGEACPGKPPAELLQGSMGGFSSTDGGVTQKAIFTSSPGGSGYRCWRYRVKRELAGGTSISNWAVLQIYIKPEDRPAEVCDKTRAGRVFEADANSSNHGTTVIAYPQQARKIVARPDVCSNDGWYLDQDNGAADKATSLTFTVLPAAGTIAGCGAAPCTIPCVLGECTFTYTPPAKVAAVGTPDFYDFTYKVVTHNNTMNRDSESLTAPGKFEVIEPPVPIVKNRTFTVDEDDGFGINIDNYQDGVNFQTLQEMNLRNGSDGYQWKLEAVTVTSCNITVQNLIPYAVPCSSDGINCAGSVFPTPDYPKYSAAETFTCNWNMRANGATSGNGVMTVTVNNVFDPPNTWGKNQPIDPGASYDHTASRSSEFQDWWGESDLQGTWKNTPYLIAIKGTEVNGLSGENYSGWPGSPKFGYVTRDQSSATSVRVDPATFVGVQSLSAFSCSGGYCSATFTPQTDYVGYASFRYKVTSCFKYNPGVCAESPVWQNWRVEVYDTRPAPILKSGNIEVGAGSQVPIVLQWTSTNPPTEVGSYYQSQWKPTIGYDTWWKSRNASAVGTSNLVGLQSPNFVCNPDSAGGLCIGTLQSQTGFVGAGGVDMNVTVGGAFTYIAPVGAWGPQHPATRFLGDRIASTSTPQHWNVTVKPLPVPTGVSVTAIKNAATPIVLKRGAGLGYTHAGNLPAQSVTVQNAHLQGGTLSSFVCDYQGATPTGDCTATFEPAANFEGVVTFDYYITDNNTPTAYTSTSAGTATIRVQPVIILSAVTKSGLTEGADTPIGYARLAYPTGGAALSGEGYAQVNNLNATEMTVATLVNGTLTGTGTSCGGAPVTCVVDCANDGDGDASKCSTTFRPASGTFYGEASYKFRVRVDGVLSDEATATLTYKARPILKTEALVLSGEQGVDLPISIAFNANTTGEYGYSHPENGKATALTVSDATNVQVKSNTCDGATGICSLVVARNPANSSGAASFRYNVTVGGLDATSPRQVNLTFAERPSVVAVAATTDLNTNLVMTFNNGDEYTMASGPATSIVTENVQNGTTVDVDGTTPLSTFPCDGAGNCVVRFKPSNNYAGNSASFQFRVYNQGVASALQTATIRVDGAPVSQPQSLSGGQGASPTFVLIKSTAGYTDPNTDPAVTVTTRNPSHGAVGAFTCDAGGICSGSFTPEQTYTGNATFEFQVTTRDTTRTPHVEKTSGWSTVTLATVAADEAPVATGKLVSNAGRGNVAISIALNDGYTDANGDKASAISFTNISGGSLSGASCNVGTGICTATFQSFTGTFGEAFARYTITANGKTSQNAGILTIRFAADVAEGCLTAVAANGSPTLDSRCALTVPVIVTTNACTLASTSASVTGVTTGAVAASAGGLSTYIQEFGTATKPFATSFQAISDQDDVANFHRTLQMTVGVPSLIRAADVDTTPVKAQGMQGIQNPFEGCTGTCRLDYASSNLASDAGGSVAVGSHFACAVENSTVRCWGKNGNGQVGDGNVGADVPYATPVDFATSGISSGSVAVAAGKDHACALLSTGEVACWGANAYGQLGDKTNTDASRPVYVQKSSGRLTNIVAIAAGVRHTCALSASKIVWCWGDGSDGKLGVASLTPRNYAANVKESGASGAANLTGILALSAGDHHTCGIQLQGDNTTRKMVCWGQNTHHEQGRGEIQVVKALGHPSLSLGSIDAINEVVTATAHGLVSGDVVVFSSATGAIAANTAYYVKANDANSLEFHTAPSLAAKLDLDGSEAGSGQVISLFSATNHGLAGGDAVVLSGGVLPTGFSATTAYHVLVATSDLFRLSATQGGTLVQPTTAGSGISATRLYPYPKFFKSGAGTDVSDVVQMGLSTAATCALKSDGTAVCAGDNSAGATGLGTTAGTTTWATPVVGIGGTGTLQNVVGVAAGDNHLCALRKDKSLVCWGDNSKGQLGNSTLVSSSTPVAVTQGAESAFAVAAGASGSCALLNSGVSTTVRCWGNNSNSQLGDGVAPGTESERSAPGNPVRTDATTAFAPRARFCSSLYEASYLP